MEKRSGESRGVLAVVDEDADKFEWGDLGKETFDEKQKGVISTRFLQFLKENLIAYCPGKTVEPPKCNPSYRCSL